MADSEDDLIALISKEQRGFRRILFAGFGTLFLLVAMSAALGVYYYMVSKNLTATSANLSETSSRLEREAFESRVESDRQTNRVSDLESSVHRTYDEIRATTVAASRRDPAIAIPAITAYLQRGDHPLAQELMIEKAARASSGASPETHALLTGAAALLAWQRSGDQITKDTKGLPASLETARIAFEKAAADQKLAPLAQTGIAWVRYINASSNRSTYAPADCEALFEAVEASAVRAQPGPQPLYWRAQCERKLGKSHEALRDYILALRQSGDVAGAAGNDATLLLAMNAFHGVGTQLIATFDVAEAELKDELALAQSLCGKGEGKGSPRMLLARACLSQAIALRKQLRQTANQISGSGENVSFSYLRDGDYEGAFANASAVERTGLFPWNELMRALSAKHLSTPAAREAEREARRNVGFYEIGRFNPCELRVLLNSDMLAEARAIVEEEHQGELLVCSINGASGAAPKP